MITNGRAFSLSHSEIGGVGPEKRMQMRMITSLTVN